MKYLILSLIFLSFNNAYASCFEQNEKSICRYPQGDGWCVQKNKKGNYSYRDECDFFENNGPVYSNDASGSGAYEVYITRLSPYNVDALMNGNSIVSAKLKESHTFKTGVVSVECQEKKYVAITNNKNEIIDESFLKSYVQSNKESIGSFICNDFFAIKNHRSIKDHFQDSAPLFKDFPVTDIYNGRNHALVLDGFSKQFGTQLGEYISVGKVNFAGKYIAANWSCKPIGCLTGAVIDATTGKVYSFPAKVNIVWPVKPEFKNNDSKEWLYKLDSRLMIFAGNVETTEKNYPDSVLFYEFTGKEFKLLKVLPYGKSQTSPEQESQTKLPSEPAGVVKQKLNTIKIVSGSISLVFLSIMFGFLVLRLS